MRLRRDKSQFVLKIGNEVGIGRVLLLGKALQIVQVHPAEDGIVFFVGDPAVQGGRQARHGGVLPHEAHQNLAGGEMLTDPIQHLQGIFHEARQDQVADHNAADQLLNKIVKGIESAAIVTPTAAKNYSDALKNIKEIHMIRSEEDIEEQKARIKNLKRQADKDEVKETGQHGVVYLPVVVDMPAPPEDDNNG